MRLVRVSFFIAFVSLGLLILFARSALDTLTVLVRLDIIRKLFEIHRSGLEPSKNDRWKRARKKHVNLMRNRCEQQSTLIAHSKRRLALYSSLSSHLLNLRQNLNLNTKRLPNVIVDAERHCRTPRPYHQNTEQNTKSNFV